MILGVDPGQTGALCLLDNHEHILIEDMPMVDGHVNMHELARIVRSWMPITIAAVELVHSMPKQGVSSSFKFGKSYGAVLGVLAALEVPYVHVPPQTWTRAHRLTSDKEGHRRRAIELWPDAAGLFARRKDDGRADAALIALWESRELFAARAS